MKQHTGMVPAAARLHSDGTVDVTVMGQALLGGTRVAHETALWLLADQAGRYGKLLLTAHLPDGEPLRKVMDARGRLRMYDPKRDGEQLPDNERPVAFGTLPDDPRKRRSRREPQDLFTDPANPKRRPVPVKAPVPAPDEEPETAFGLEPEPAQGFIAIDDIPEFDVEADIAAALAEKKPSRRSKLLARRA